MDTKPSINVLVHFSLSHYENVGTSQNSKWEYCQTTFGYFHTKVDIKTLIHDFENFKEKISKRVMEKVNEISTKYGNDFNKFEYNEHEIYHVGVDEEISEYEIL